MSYFRRIMNKHELSTIFLLRANDFFLLNFTKEKRKMLFFHISMMQYLLSSLNMTKKECD